MFKAKVADFIVFNKTPLIIFTVGSIIFGLIFLWLIYAQAPDKIGKRIEKGFADIGLIVDTLPAPETSANALIYKNIKFKNTSQSSVKELRIKYNPLNAIVFRSVESIDIEGLNIISKLEYNTFPQRLPIPDLIKHIESIRIYNGMISITDQNAARISFSLTANRDETEHLKIQGNISLQSENAALEGRFSGLIQKNEALETNIEFERARFKNSNQNKTFKITRANGQINIKQQPSKNFLLQSDIRAGGMNLNETPWQNTIVKLEISEGQKKTLINATAAGHENIELKLDIDNKNASKGMLIAKNASALKNYIAHITDINFKFGKAKGDAKLPAYAPSPVANTEKNQGKQSTEISIPFKIKDDGTINFTSQIINGNNTFPINGALNKNVTQTQLAISSGSINLEQIFKNTPKNIMNGKGRIRLKFSQEKNTSQSSKETKKQAIYDIRNGQFNFSPVNIGNVNGTIKTQNIESLSLLNIQNIPCTAGNNPPQEVQTLQAFPGCNIAITMSGGYLNIENVTAPFLTGQIEIKNINFKENEAEYKILARDIALNTLTQKIGLPQIQSSGLLAISMDVKRNNQDQSIIISQGLITSTGSGILEYNVDTLPPIFSGNPLELETLKTSLKNFYYENMSISFSGPAENANITFLAKGYNPKIYSAQAITVKLNTTADIRPFLKKAFN